MALSTLNIMGKPKPWEFTEGLDTPESWPFFKAYRDAKGSRALSRVRYCGWENGARIGVPTLAQMVEWYRTQNWAKRASKYDGHMDSVAQEERELIARKSAADAELAHKRLLDTLGQTAQIEADKALGKAASTDEATMRTGDLTKLTQAVISGERLIHGQVTERHENVIDVEALSPEERAVLLKLTLSQKSED
jgi:hypothetical protein